MKLSFKNHYPGGRYRSFGHIYADINVDGKQVGAINYSSVDNAMRILLHVKKGEGFRNVILKKQFPTSYNEREAINEAKEWLKKYWPEISSKYDLYRIDDTVAVKETTI